ncbi:unnamed protein product [Lactuca saligna]|uniref:Uncharacterized protein n=1 Tax=Lactuca saligna TaxID=75948 RepID=A0AA36EMX0_LACSI|nr:unnamed protein product [Lactuca saligna]
MGLKWEEILCGSTYQSKIFNISRRHYITSTVFDKFEHFFHILIHEGFQPLKELYYKTWLHSGQRVIIQEKNQKHDLPIENVVTVQGLPSSGYLLANVDNGERCELHPDGNRLVEEDNAEELSVNGMTLKPKRSRKEGRTRLRELRTRRLIATLVWVKRVRDGKAFIHKSCTTTNYKPALRLKILFNLYNLLKNPYSQFYVYMNALKLAMNGKVIEHIIPSFKKIDSFLKEWNLGVHDQRGIFLTISNILKKHKREEHNLKDSNGYQSNNAPAYAHNVHVSLLPLFLFTSYSLKHFTLTSIEIGACNIMPKTPWDFPALTTLHIRGIVLCGGMTIEKGKKMDKLNPNIIYCATKSNLT